MSGSRPWTANRTTRFGYMKQSKEDTQRGNTYHRRHFTDGRNSDFIKQNRHDEIRINKDKFQFLVASVIISLLPSRVNVNVDGPCKVLHYIASRTSAHLKAVPQSNPQYAEKGGIISYTLPWHEPRINSCQLVLSWFRISTGMPQAYKFGTCLTSWHSHSNLRK